MGHGDDFGLRLPPALAPAQVVVLVVKDGPRACGRRPRRWWPSCAAAGHRVRLDDRTDTSFGRRSVDWELKGVPVRVEVGPRDLAEGNVTVVTRHRREKENVAAGRGRRHWSAAILAAGRARAPGRGHGGPRGPHGGRRDTGGGGRGGGAGFARIRLGALGPDGEDRLADARPHHPLPAAARRRLAEPGDDEDRSCGRPVVAPVRDQVAAPADCYNPLALSSLKISTSLKRGLRPTLSLCGALRRAGTKVMVTVERR